MKSTLFDGSWQKVLIKVILLLLVLYVMYIVIKKFIPNKFEKDHEKFVDDLVNDPTGDGTTPADPDTITDADALLIANSLQTHMNYTIFGLTATNEEGMFQSLQCLNGASLNKVYGKFGMREYDGVKQNLFGWFAGELSDSLFVTSIWHNECVEGCKSPTDNCHDLTYMRAIWSKSSIPLTF